LTPCELGPPTFTESAGVPDAPPPVPPALVPDRPPLSAAPLAFAPAAGPAAGDPDDFAAAPAATDCFGVDPVALPPVPAEPAALSDRPPPPAGLAVTAAGAALPASAASVAAPESDGKAPAEPDSAAPDVVPSVAAAAWLAGKAAGGAIRAPQPVPNRARTLSSATPCTAVRVFFTTAPLSCVAASLQDLFGLGLQLAAPHVDLGEVLDLDAFGAA